MKPTTYIVCIQIKDNRDVPPISDVSRESLSTLIKQINSQEGLKLELFRGIPIKKENIKHLRIYELDFGNYKKQVIEKSNTWRKLYQNLGFFEAMLNIILKFFVYKKDIGKVSEDIMYDKVKYLTDNATELLWQIERMDENGYTTNEQGKEIIDTVRLTENNNFTINDKDFSLSSGKSEKSTYFLELLCSVSREKRLDVVQLGDIIALYEEENSDTKLTLTPENIRKSYIATINKHILKKYDREILEIKEKEVCILVEPK